MVFIICMILGVTELLAVSTNSSKEINSCKVSSVMADSVWPQRRQPTRFPRPWDSPGKNTGVGCHFLLQCMKVKSESEVAQSCLTQRPRGLQPTRLLRPWDFPGKRTGVGCHCLLQEKQQEALIYTDSSTSELSFQQGHFNIHFYLI